MSANARDNAVSAIQAARNALQSGGNVNSDVLLVTAAACAATASGDPGAIAAVAAVAAAKIAVNADSRPAMGKSNSLVADATKAAARATRAAGAMATHFASARAASVAADRADTAAIAANQPFPRPGDLTAAATAAATAATAAIDAVDSARATAIANDAAAVADRILPLLRAIPGTPSREKDDLRADIFTRIASLSSDERIVHRAQTLMAKALAHTPAPESTDFPAEFNQQRALDVLATISVRIMCARPTVQTSLTQVPALRTLAAVRVQQSLDGASEMRAIPGMLRANLAGLQAMVSPELKPLWMEQLWRQQEDQLKQILRNLC